MNARRIVVAGVSARAAAESAAVAGYRVTAIDAFGDLDQHPDVRAVQLGSRFSASAAARTAAGMSGDAFVYLANFENHPKAVAALAAAGTLWGNPMEVIERARRNESSFADEFAGLQTREAAHRETLMQEGVRLRMRLDDVVLPRPPLPDVTTMTLPIYLSSP